MPAIYTRAKDYEDDHGDAFCDDANDRATGGGVEPHSTGDDVEFTGPTGTNGWTGRADADAVTIVVICMQVP